ncbi:rRNA pseudouridine synthase [Leptothermofonsia sichuanensis E412]|uniref:pseudouridine synthase n=1 Tax=Leptothermofonsia sichuanensis TaxID=2917832 RepID=UPI001CA6655F|nr:pseudouridine synthase [Leptothermofonsia sichuanensis]QZZ22414.1 rRNA pseudouridine synthase [Leptothermofonsia sichuanensis E412]
MDERIQKILSQWGIASRRQAEQMILEGRVRLNGVVVQLGQKANPALDHIEVDGLEIRPAGRPEPVYLLLNKPAGVVSTCTDPWNRVTVIDLLPPALQKHQGIHPVGRLDADSTGALLLTNDGDLTFYLTHPRHHIPKTYEVWVEGYPAVSVLQQWRCGVDLDGQLTRPARVDVIQQHPDHKTLLRIILKEGRNRQIRRVAEQFGHPVIHLHRTAIGPIQLQSPGSPPLLTGKYRLLKDAEISSLKAQFDLTSERMPVKRSAAHE